ncbi:MAG: hypothetical protein R3E31_22175 [Chloroflexota bacterium]
MDNQQTIKNELTLYNQVEATVGRSYVTLSDRTPGIQICGLELAAIVRQELKNSAS